MLPAIGRRARFLVLLVTTAGILAAGCGSSNPSPGRDAGSHREGTGRVKVTSPAFSEGDSIPERFTCDGEDVSPRLVLENVADTAASLALIVDDPDAPGGTFVHWLLWNIPPDVKALPESLPRQGRLPSLGDAHQGTNNFDSIGYRGPCPPPNSQHRYRFQLYVLGNSLDLEPGAREPALRKAMQGDILARDVLEGRYSR